MNRQILTNWLDGYQPFNSLEESYIERFIALLQEELCYSRDLLKGHITASAWILNEPKNSVLMMHHRKLDKWLQPGGHADREEDLINVSRKEAAEETGLTKLTLLSNSIFDLDIHRIPERKGIRAHDHYDVRFLFSTDPNSKIQGNHESNALKWIRLDELESYVGKDPSIIRMRDKCLNQTSN